MKKRKLKGFVLPSIYLLVLCTLAIGITFLSKDLMAKNEPNEEHYNYTMSVFDEESEEMVNNEISEENKITPSKPYTDENVTILKHFYNADDNAENQEKALIYYENTYMQNTGIFYQNDNTFEVVAAIDGTVKEVKNDEILGTVLTLESSKNITCVYYTLGELKVKVGDTVKQNDILATSGQSKIETTKQTLLFEVYVKGILTDPATFFNQNLNELE